jgi:hypothetical protein
MLHAVARDARVCMCVPIHPRLLSQPVTTVTRATIFRSSKPVCGLVFYCKSVAAERGAFLSPEPVRYMLESTGSVLVSLPGGGTVISCHFLFTMLQFGTG